MCELVLYVLCELNDDDDGVMMKSLLIALTINRTTTVLVDAVFRCWCSVRRPAVDK